MIVKESKRNFLVLEVEMGLLRTDWKKEPVFVQFDVRLQLQNAYRLKKVERIVY